jgi:hypothetical protein
VSAKRYTSPPKMVTDPAKSIRKAHTDKGVIT